MKYLTLPRSCGGCFRFALPLAAAFVSLHAATPADAPITPRETIALFNGKDLSTFYVWLPKFGRSDPDRVFSVVDRIDGAPALRISGQHYGGLVTHQAYANYKLVAEFRWGLLTWEPRKDRARDNGILLHCQGEDGNAAKNFTSPWYRSVEFQIIEGGTGDIILVNGYDRGNEKGLGPHLFTTLTGKSWDPAGKLTEMSAARIDWQYRDPEWKDVLGFRGKKDVEKPTGEWNHIEAICEGGNVTYFVNGVQVNAGRDGTFTSGRLLVQSEGAEIYYRKIELQPLKR